MTDKTGVGQPRPQGLLLDDVQNGGSSGEDPGKGWTNSPADWPIYANKLIQSILRR